MNGHKMDEMTLLVMIIIITYYSKAIIDDVLVNRNTLQKFRYQKCAISKQMSANHRDIFRDTLFAKKYGEGEDRTHDLLAGRH